MARPKTRGRLIHYRRCPYWDSPTFSAPPQPLWRGTVPSVVPTRTTEVSGMPLMFLLVLAGGEAARSLRVVSSLMSAADSYFTRHAVSADGESVIIGAGK